MSKEIQPPKLADRFLEWYCDPALLEDLQGDFHERFTQRLRYYSPFKAKRLYWWDVIRFFKPYTINKNKNGLHPSAIFMFGNYLKTSYRGLMKEKVNTLVSILGLGLGLSAFILISLYVNDELKYDRYLSNSERIYRITTSYTSETSKEHAAWGEPSVGPMCKERYAEIENYTSLVNEPVTVRNDNRPFANSIPLGREEKFFYSDTNYFSVFDYQFIKGSKKSFKANTIVLTESVARKYFEDEDPLGKSLGIEKREFLVVGIIEDLPLHTDLKFDAMMAISNVSEISGWTFNFLLFKKGSKPESFQPKLDRVFQESVQLEFDDYSTEGRYHMEKLSDVHFGTPKVFDTPKSSKTNLYLFSSVALLILIIAGINHLNLSLATTARKQSEVGIRKAIGAKNGEIRFQFLTKSLIICILSLVIGVLIALYFLPYLNIITSKQVDWTEVFSFKISLYLIGSIILLAIAAGSYPAFYLAAVKPVEVLKGRLKLGGKTLVMKSLIVLQFTISLTLIISSILISRQLQLLQNKNHGMTQDPVMLIDVPRNKSFYSAVNKYKYDLLQLPFVNATSVVGFNSWPTQDMDIDVYEVKQNGEWSLKPFNNIEVDEGYFETLDLTFIAGRIFTQEETRGAYQAVIVNKAFVDNMQWVDPLNEVVVHENGVDSRVVGVIDNFHYKSMKTDFEPILIFPENRFPEKLLVRIEAENWMDHIEQIELDWKTNMKGQPFEFQFLNDQIQAQYADEVAMRKVFNFFVVIAISVACLGLFGLVSLSSANRLKEIGIRKVMGAKSSQLWFALTRDYLTLIFIAFVVSIPVAAIGISSWLENFIYKTSISVDAFLISGLVTLIVAAITMSFHVIRASNINPTTILNHE